MDFYSKKEPEQVVGDYMEHEMSEYRKVTERELSNGSIAPEARQAFSRKPYYTTVNAGLKKRPVIR